MFFLSLLFSGKDDDDTKKKKTSKEDTNIPEEQKGNTHLQKIS
jgi:hypothetical protein